MNSSRWDRYLGMTAVMTQVPVPTARTGCPAVAVHENATPIEISSPK